MKANQLNDQILIICLRTSMVASQDTLDPCFSSTSQVHFRHNRYPISIFVYIHTSPLSKPMHPLKLPNTTTSALFSITSVVKSSSVHPLQNVLTYNDVVKCRTLYSQLPQTSDY